MFDKLRKNATKVLGQHGDKVAKGLDKAADAADKRTKGKYSGQIRTGVGKAKESLDRHDDKRGRDVGGPASPDASRPDASRPDASRPDASRPDSPPGTPPGSGPQTPPGGGSTPQR